MVRPLVWAMAFTGFILVAIGYFVAIVFRVSEPWPFWLGASALVLEFGALPAQFIADAYFPRPRTTEGE